MVTAEELKAKGNAALQAGNTSEAIEHYTSAINIDGSKHVYYSNRSAAYLKKGDAVNALEDAESCIGLNPDFAKGYSRKGAALHALKRFNDSAAAYEAGLAKFPSDAGLTKGLADVKRDQNPPPPSFNMFGGGGGGNNPMAGLFGPELMAKIAMDPKTRPYLQDDDFMEKLKSLQRDPNKLTEMLGDRRIMEVFQLMLGGQVGAGGGDEGMDFGKEDEDDEEEKEKVVSEAKVEGKVEETKAMESEPEKEEEEDLSDLSPKEVEIRQKKKDSIAAKERGNALYKSKKFDEALSAYDEAIVLDPTNMAFHSNKGAVYFTTKKYDECIECCVKAVEVGEANRAPFEDRGRALTRAAKAYHKKGDLVNAIEMCKKAQLENYDKATHRLLKMYELEKKKADTMAYQSEEKAEEAKQRGNTHFRNKEWAEAVKEYEEAVKRSPTNAPIRNNLSAALCKIMDFNGAKTQIEKALELDPKYVKAWARKGDIEVVMKENHKAMDSYRKGLEIDPTNATCKEGLRKVTAMVNAGSRNMSEAERKERAEHAMADPEIQAILQDPVINQVLKDFQENPTAAQEAMRDPLVATKLEKLIAAGVLQTG